MATPGWRELFSGGHGGRAVALAAGVTLHAVNIFVVTTIMPSVVAEIGGLAYYAWNATLFIVGSIIGSALSSELLARRGVRGAYRLAAVCFAAGTLIAALAPAMPVLLLGRGIQGLGGGMLFALSYALIRLVLPQELWPRAIALVSGTWGVAALSGPFVGGIFAEIGEWRLAFWSVLAATAAFALLCARVLPSPSAAPRVEAPPRFPVRRLALLAGAALAISGASVIPSIWVNAAGMAVAIALLFAMVRIESGAAVRLLPSDALRPGTPLGAVYLTMALTTVGTNCIVFVPLLLQTLHGLTPLGAGYLTVLQALGWTVGSLLSAGSGPGRVARSMVLGPAAMTIGLALLAWRMPLASHSDPAAIATIGCLLAVVGMGVGFSWPHLLTRAMTVAPDGERSLASSSISTVQLVTSAFASALAGVVANLAGITDPGGAVGGANAALWLFGLFALGPLTAAAAAALLIAPAVRSARTEA
ncbi:MFS transporter [Stella humosa]|uniref:MFS transporter n=1 Tax=Stella humosa TaxID=94 RepID=A0A3N1M8G2_9PROT|nr:MFS transporter [Stella humosa]ROP99970.1 MFS transporter [Stella humosa]BBK30799.1 MFS transporter [Stella humosa]